MTILDNYLNELFGINRDPLKKYEFVDRNDPSLPNPYNFRKLKLDKKITRQDILNANKEWIPVVKKGWTGLTRPPKFPQDSFEGVVKDEDNILFTIVDNGKRVGIVGFNNKNFMRLKTPENSIVYVTWVHGKSYAAAGVMKLLNMPFVPQFNKVGSKVYFTEIWWNPHKDNIASNKTSLKLKPDNARTSGNHIIYDLTAPYWWNNNKLLK